MYEFVCISYNCNAETIIYNQVDIFYIFVIQLSCSTNAYLYKDKALQYQITCSIMSFILITWKIPVATRMKHIIEWCFWRASIDVKMIVTRITILNDIDYTKKVGIALLLLSTENIRSKYFFHNLRKKWLTC